MATFQRHRHHASRGNLRDARDTLLLVGRRLGASALASFAATRTARRSRNLCRQSRSAGGLWLCVACGFRDSDAAYRGDDRGVAGVATLRAQTCAFRRARDGTRRRSLHRSVRRALVGILALLHRHGGTDSRRQSKNRGPFDERPAVAASSRSLATRQSAYAVVGERCAAADHAAVVR